MKRRLNTIIVSGICVFVAAVTLAIPSAVSLAQGTGGQTASTPAKKIPAYNAAAPKTALGPTLDPALFTDVSTRNSYAMAAKVKNVLYQQPCFCYCDDNDGHHSLYDCFVTVHASNCNICRMEAIYAYEQTRKGLTPAQIRKAIINDEWRKIDLRNYQTLKDIR